MAGLPRRDLVLLPLLSVVTVAAILAATEVIARRFFPDPEPDACFSYPPGGPREKPNCTSVEREPETPRVKNAFNACGYRTFADCGPKRSGSIRIVVLGSSVAEALLVPMDRSYVSLATAELHKATHRPVEIEPIAAPLTSPAHLVQRMPEILALSPDAAVLVLSPIDIEALYWFVSNPGERPPAKAPRYWWNQFYRAVQDRVKESRTVLAAEHLLFQDPGTYLRLYLLYGYKADFLRTPFSPQWQQRFRELDGIIAALAQPLESHHIPFFITAAPSRADATLLSSQTRHARVDPYAWGREIARIARAHDAFYIDLLHPFAEIPRSDLLFYIVDGHMNERAQPVLSHAIVRALLPRLPHS